MIISSQLIAGYRSLFGQKGVGGYGGPGRPHPGKSHQIKPLKWFEAEPDHRVSENQARQFGRIPHPASRIECSSPACFRFTPRFHSSAREVETASGWFSTAYEAVSNHFHSFPIKIEKIPSPQGNYRKLLGPALPTKLAVNSLASERSRRRGAGVRRDVILEAPHPSAHPLLPPLTPVPFELILLPGFPRAEARGNRYRRGG
jgi:hypothetical protein